MRMKAFLLHMSDCRSIRQQNNSIPYHISFTVSDIAEGYHDSADKAATGYGVNKFCCWQGNSSDRDIPSELFGYVM